ncbi:FUSC family protein [Azorhizobium oxalatiphilum]|uniref:FUSC family protein n=1 Tax=Azorhizobium oxalatiphilum TaxID=980631 RepID=UPI00166BCE7D|nr:FUSC family protein [Azorhizobium oxalatiphilum]
MRLAEHNERGRKPLLQRLRSWLDEHDPGGIDQIRAFHLALAYVVIIICGVTTSRAFGLNLDVTFPMIGAMTASVLITFTPAASVPIEAKSFLRVFAVTIGLLAIVAIIGPGSHPENALVLKLLLVPLSCIAMYLRRYGMDGQRLGIALIIIATVATILRPTREEGAWLLLASVEGFIITALIRLSPFRPSAMQAYNDGVVDAVQGVGDYLRLLADAIRNSTEVPKPALTMLHRLRVRVRVALLAATTEEPEARGWVEAVRTHVYRLRVATQLLRDCIPPMRAEGNDRAWAIPIASMAEEVARHLDLIGRVPGHRDLRLDDALTRLRRAATAPDLDPKVQLTLLRAVTAFERLALLVSGLEKFHLERPVEENVAAYPSQPEPKVAPEPFFNANGLSPSMRVAVQALIATTITTSLDLILGLDHAYWATMTVMFVLGNSLGETYVRVRYRTWGTVLGVLVGVAAVHLMHNGVWVLAGICLAGQVIGLLTMRDRYDIASAATGLSVVVGLHLVTGLTAEGMISRIYETAIGAVVALVISYLVLPIYGSDEVIVQVKTVVARCRSAFAGWWPRGEKRESVSELAWEMRPVMDRLPQIDAESSLGHRAAGEVVNLVSTLDILTTYLALLEDAAQRLSALQPPEEIVNALEAARSRTLQGFDLALGDAAPAAEIRGAPQVDAALSAALGQSTDETARRLLPFVADYLAFSDAILQPLADLRTVLNPPPATSTVPAKVPKDTTPDAQEAA